MFARRLSRGMLRFLLLICLLSGGLLAAVNVGVTGNLQGIIEWLYARGVDLNGLIDWFDVYNFPQNAVVSNDSLYQLAAADPDQFWDQHARELEWFDRWVGAGKP